VRAARRVRVALAGGVTGGHLFPGLAVARNLAGDSPEAGRRPVVYGSARSSESAWVEAHADHVPMPAPMLPSSGREVPGFLLRLCRAVHRSLSEIRARRTDLVLGLGGYASVPPGLAALVARRPLLLLEQNVVPGRANRLLARLGGRVAATYEESLRHLPAAARARARVVGNPVRPGILAGERDPSRFGLAGDRPILLVMGGSQGATGLNTRVLQAADVLARRGIQVMHLAGRRDEARVRRGLREAAVRAWVSPFALRMGPVYATADLVLCRAGGTSVAELAAAGRPSVLVPYPHHRDRHQERNALVLVGAGAARMIPEDELTRARFESDVADLIEDQDRLAAMGSAASRLAVPDAAERVARWAVELAGEVRR
jgi:UDP-N-acetylglucosamine--N-acetylmuramyl-(pentapeptide) pyrophosphoryl-undecaprenol N-acetylglucosamine transferase